MHLQKERQKLEPRYKTVVELTCKVYLSSCLGHPLPNPGYNCAVVDPSVRYLWQSLPCSNKLGFTATVKRLKKLLHEVNKNIFFFPSDFGYSITEIFLNTYFITLLFMISWDRFLFKPLDTLQWPLLPQESGSENMV